MSWVRIDDGMPQHPKVSGLSPPAFVLHIRALCWCSRYLTNGFVKSSAEATLTGDLIFGLNQTNATDAINDLTGQLEASGLWKKARGGWIIHDYLKYNPCKDKVLEDRERGKKRAQSSHNLRVKIEDSSPDLHPTPAPAPTPKKKHITPSYRFPKGTPVCEDCKTVLQELNQLTGRHYRGDGNGLKNIHARHSAYSLEDCLKVIRVKVSQWVNNPEMSKYLRPSTLFGKTKFDGYVNEPTKVHDKDLFVGKHSEEEEWGTVTFPDNTQN